MTFKTSRIAVMYVYNWTNKIVNRPAFVDLIMCQQHARIECLKNEYYVWNTNINENNNYFWT